MSAGKMINGQPYRAVSGFMQAVVPYLKSQSADDLNRLSYHAGTIGITLASHRTDDNIKKIKNYINRIAGSACMLPNGTCLVNDAKRMIGKYEKDKAKAAAESLEADNKKREISKFRKPSSAGGHDAEKMKNKDFGYHTNECTIDSLAEMFIEPDKSIRLLEIYSDAKDRALSDIIYPTGPDDTGWDCYKKLMGRVIDMEKAFGDRYFGLDLMVKKVGEGLDNLVDRKSMNGHFKNIVENAVKDHIDVFVQDDFHDIYSRMNAGFTRDDFLFKVAWKYMAKNALSSAEKGLKTDDIDSRADAWDSLVQRIGSRFPQK